MLNSFIIVLREGFEAFLVVAIMTAYLRKTGRKQLLPAVYAAVAASVVASLRLVMCYGKASMKPYGKPYSARLRSCLSSLW
jgi:FTR1 family protein